MFFLKKILNEIKKNQNKYFFFVGNGARGE